MLVYYTLFKFPIIIALSIYYELCCSFIDFPKRKISQVRTCAFSARHSQYVHAYINLCAYVWRAWGGPFSSRFEKHVILFWIQVCQEINKSVLGRKCWSMISTRYGQKCSTFLRAYLYVYKYEHVWRLRQTLPCVAHIQSFLCFLCLRKTAELSFHQRLDIFIHTQCPQINTIRCWFYIHLIDILSRSSGCYKQTKRRQRPYKLHI